MAIKNTFLLVTPLKQKFDSLRLFEKLAFLTLKKSD